MDPAAFQNLISSIPPAPGSSGSSVPVTSTPTVGAFGLPLTAQKSTTADATPAPTTAGSKIANFLGVAGKGIGNFATGFGKQALKDVEGVTDTVTKPIVALEKRAVSLVDPKIAEKAFPSEGAQPGDLVDPAKLEAKNAVQKAGGIGADFAEMFAVPEEAIPATLDKIGVNSLIKYAGKGLLDPATVEKISSAFASKYGQGALQVLKNAAVAGTQQVASNAADQKPLLEDVPESSAIGGVAGTVGENILNKILPDALKSAPQITKEATVAAEKHSGFLDELLTPTMTKNATASAIKTGKVAEGEGFTGNRDFTDAIPGFDDIKAAVQQVPGVAKGNTLLENVNAIHDAIGTAAQDLRSQLANQEVKPVVTQDQLNGFLSGVKDDISKNPLLVGNAETTAGRILNHFQTLLPQDGDITGEDVLDARQGLDRWIGSLKPNAFDPATENAVSIALRAVRQGANKLIADGNPDVAVKQLLSHQTNLYNAIDAIAPKAAKEGSSAFQRVVSTIKNNPITSTAVGGGLTALGVDKALKSLTGVGF